MQTAKKEKVLKAIGVNIQKVRKAKAKEPKEMATLLGITTQVYGNIEHGKTDISISRILELADVLQTNYQQILNIESATTYHQTATNNSGGNNILNADTLIIDENKKLILQLEKENLHLRADMEKRLADKDKIIGLMGGVRK